MSLLDEILSTNKVTDAQGGVHPLHSHTRAEQCQFIVDIINRIDARRCLETGLAYGVSALAICGAIREKEGRIYYSIDPHQEYWKNIGINNLKIEKYWDFVDFYANYSDEVLPFLWNSGVKLDFVYRDSTKIFDIACVDVHFCHKMLRIGGVLVLDDVGYPGVRRLARLMVQQPQWKLIASFGQKNLSPRRTFLANAVSFAPFRNELIAPEFDNLERENGLQAQSLAFEKVGEDSRNWDWSVKF